MQNKTPFEIILHLGLGTSLQSWMARKSCHSETLVNKCSISDYPYMDGFRCEESKYHNCFVCLPNIKSQRKRNEVGPRPAPYDSIQMSRTL